MWAATLALLALVVSTRGHQHETCYANDRNPFVHFAAQAPYDVKEKTSTQYHLINNCEPVLLWSLVRHINQLPTIKLKALEQLKLNVINNYDTRAIDRVSNVRMCQSDVENLRNWYWMPNQWTLAGNLIRQGYLDMQSIGRSLSSKFQQIMTTDRYDYLFKFVKNQQDNSSFRAYVEDVFRQHFETLNIPTYNYQPKLEPHKHCPAWTKTRTTRYTKQYNTFISKEEFQMMMRNISSRLGFSHALSRDDVSSMWQMCRLNKALSMTQPSPWCAAFTKDDLKRLEYIEDLKTYYGAGYGSPVNAHLGCVFTKDMVNFFTKYIMSPSMPTRPKAMVTVTSNLQLLMTLSAMGAFKDSVPLTGDNYHTASMQTRQWRTSKFDPWNANLVAVLYRCRDAGEQFRVMFFLNERPLRLEGCAVGPHAGLCDWSWVHRTYGHMVHDGCKLTEYCRSGATVAAGSAALATLLPLIGFLASI